MKTPGSNQTIASKFTGKEETMKNTKNLLKIMLVSALLVCAAALGGISAFAEADTTLSITTANVAYNENTHLAFTIEGSVADGNEIGLAVWDKDVAEPNADNVSYYSFESYTLKGVTYYKTEGIPASEMSATIYVAPATRATGDDSTATVAGKIIDYSIYKYVNSRLAQDGLTDAQLKLYTNVVTYGNYAEKIINNSVNTRILVAKNGYAGKGAKYGLALTEGDTALITASTVNADGEYFLYWTDAEGNQIYDRVTNVTLNDNSTVYTAKYGSKTESAYAGRFDFDSLTVGALDFGTPSTTNAPTLHSTGIYYHFQEKLFANNKLRFAAIYQVNSADDPTVVKTTSAEIKEDNGVNYLSFDKAFSGVTGTEVEFKSSATNTERIEVDMCFTNVDSNEDFALYFTFSDGTTSKRCRINAHYQQGGDLYLRDSTDTNPEATQRYAGNIALGEKFTLTAERNDNGLVVVKINGVAITNAYNGDYMGDGFSLNTELDTTKEIYGNNFKLEIYSYAYLAADFYTVNFVDTDKFN